MNLHGTCPNGYRGLRPKYVYCDVTEENCCDPETDWQASSNTEASKYSELDCTNCNGDEVENEF